MKFKTFSQKIYLFVLKILILTICLTSITISAEENSNAEISPNSIDNNNNQNDKSENYETFLEPLPCYYVQGNKDVKMTMGFNYLLVDDTRLFFTYYQYMLWDPYAFSLPLIDIEINPKFHYYYHLNWGNFDTLDIGLWEHNSNGTADDDDSRSFDRSYLKIFYHFNSTRISIEAALKLFVLYRFGFNSNDIGDHLGIWKYSQSITFYTNYYIFEKASFDFRFFAGHKLGYKLTKGGQELGIRFKFIKLRPELYMQFYHGYHQIILYNDINVTRYRAGFILFI